MVSTVIKKNMLLTVLTLASLLGCGAKSELAPRIDDGEYARQSLFNLDKRDATLNDLLTLKFKVKAKLEKIDQYLDFYENGSLDLSTEQLLHLKTADEQLKKQLENIMKIFEKCYDSNGSCEAIPTLIVVNFPPLNLKAIAQTKSLYTDHWSYEYPNANPKVSKDANRAYWVHKDALVLKDPNNKLIQQRLTIYEEICDKNESLLNLEKIKPLIETEAVSAIVGEEYSNGKTYVAAVYRDIKTNSCISFEFYPVNDSKYSLDDNSEVSRVIKSLFLSVKLK